MEADMEIFHCLPRESNSLDSLIMRDERALWIALLRVSISSDRHPLLLLKVAPRVVVSIA